MIPRELLVSGADELGISLSSEQVDTVFLYAAELTKWNRKINLTAITNERDVIVKHFLDSLAYLKGFDPAPAMRLLDLGSGAGFPAIPIKIVYPDLRVTLVESVKKKGSFLRHIIRTLGLVDADVRDVRIEELPESSRKSYDVVTARAFADIDAAVAAGTDFLKPGGMMVLSRGSEEKAEEEMLSHYHMILVAKTGITLPHSDYKRVIWTLRKAIS